MNKTAFIQLKLESFPAMDIEIFKLFPEQEKIYILLQINAVNGLHIRKYSSFNWMKITLFKQIISCESII